MAMPVSAILGDLADALGARRWPCRPPRWARQFVLGVLLLLMPWLGTAWCWSSTCRLAAWAGGLLLGPAVGQPGGGRGGRPHAGRHDGPAGDGRRGGDRGCSPHGRGRPWPRRGGRSFRPVHQRSLDADLGLGPARLAPPCALICAGRSGLATLDVDGVAGVWPTGGHRWWGGWCRWSRRVGRTHRGCGAGCRPRPVRPARRAGDVLLTTKPPWLMWCAWSWPRSWWRRVGVPAAGRDTLAGWPRGGRGLQPLCSPHGSSLRPDQDWALAPDPRAAQQGEPGYDHRPDAAWTISGCHRGRRQRRHLVARFDPRRGLAAWGMSGCHGRRPPKWAGLGPAAGGRGRSPAVVARWISPALAATWRIWVRRRAHFRSFSIQPL